MDNFHEDFEKATGSNFDELFYQRLMIQRKIEKAREHHNSNEAVTVFDEVFRIEHLVSIAKIYKQKIAFYWYEDKKRIQNLGARIHPEGYMLFGLILKNDEWLPQGIICADYAAINTAFHIWKGGSNG